jgi:predicted phosphodiesterase
MRTAIYSDVHGNLPAFEAFVETTKGEVDFYLNLGDLVNYGPWSNECVDLALSLPTRGNILGNHEELFLNPLEISNEKELVQLFFNTTYSRFARFEKIATFQKSFHFGEFIAQHTIDNLRVYPDTKIELKDNWLIGHTHHQFLYENCGFKLINPGSIGQNRTNLETVQYSIHDEVTNEFKFYSIKQDSSSLMQKMISLNYPEECLNYYQSKI